MTALGGGGRWVGGIDQDVASCVVNMGSKLYRSQMLFSTQGRNVTTHPNPLQKVPTEDNLSHTPQCTTCFLSMLPVIILKCLISQQQVPEAIARWERRHL